MVVTITGINEINKVYEELKAMYPGNEAFANGFVPADCVSGWNSTLWPFAGYSVDAVANTLSLEFRYQHVVNGSNGDSALPPLFTSFTVPGEITADQLATLADVTIDVVGHAIQQTGFADADAAWAAFDAQNAAVSD